MSAQTAIPFDDRLDDIMPLPGETPPPAGWRAPTRMSREHYEETCLTCGAAAPCGYGGQFYCVACVPAGWLPAGAR